MNTSTSKLYSTTLVLTVLLLAVALFGVTPGVHAQSATQATYSSPDNAMQALVKAVTAADRAAIATIFGPDHEQLLSGDEIEDANDLADFAKAVNESAQLQKAGDSSYTVVVGKNSYPMPIPIVQKDGKWMFDTKAGLDEVLNRRIGENELSAISTCRAYAIAQWEYFTEGDWDNDGVAEYAQHLVSSPGEHDGLYWETSEGEKPSPLGKLVAAAREEGYAFKSHRRSGSDQSAKPTAEPGSEQVARVHQRTPFHGYYLKILKNQGPHAPGGKYSYIINGNMIAGYALVAFPDKWGNSGVMTFIINQQGRVYQKNLGPETAKIAAAITEYNPDPTWKLVQAQP
ncbi:MAG: DUF2950 domain-containing protein [Candidatus Acidiferrum sp.]